MNFLHVTRLGDEALAAEIEAWRRAGNSHLPTERVIPLNNTLHYPWWVSQDKRQIVFARRLSGSVQGIVAFEVAGPEISITAGTYACVFTLAAGEGWMCDGRRATQRELHVRRAIGAAYAAF